MGQTLSEPDTNKNSTHDANNKYFYGCSQMQGWRLSNLKKKREREREL